MSKKAYKKALAANKVYAEPSRKLKDGTQLYNLYVAKK